MGVGIPLPRNHPEELIEFNYFELRLIDLTVVADENSEFRRLILKTLNVYLWDGISVGSDVKYHTSFTKDRQS